MIQLKRREKVLFQLKYVMTSVHTDRASPEHPQLHIADAVKERDAIIGSKNFDGMNV